MTRVFRYSGLCSAYLFLSLFWVWELTLLLQSAPLTFPCYYLVELDLQSGCLSMV